MEVDLGSKIPSKIHQKSTPNRSNIEVGDQKRLNIDLGRQEKTVSEPKIMILEPKMPILRAKRPILEAKKAPGQFRMDFSAPFGRSWARFGSLGPRFGRVWAVKNVIPNAPNNETTKNSVFEKKNAELVHKSCKEAQKKLLKKPRKNCGF